MVQKKDIDIIKKSLLISVLSLLVILVFVELNPVFRPYVKVANLGIQDILLSKFSTNTTVNKNIIIVAIDDKTLSDDRGLGRWQDFKRSYYAKVIDNLKRDGAIVVGIDVLFSEKSADSEKDEDILLSKAIKDAGNVILGFSLNEKIFPIDMLKTPIIGYFEPVINTENKKVYSFNPVDNRDDPQWESFSFAIARKYLNEITGKSTVLNKETSKYTRYKTINKFGKEVFIPYASEDYNEGIYINYTPVKFPEISFSDAYRDSAEYINKKGLVKDKIVLIGSTASALHDEFYTPAGILDGVLLHANMINTILNGNFITKVKPLVEIIFLIILTLLLTIFILKVDYKIYQIIFVFIVLTGATTFEVVCFSWFNKLFNYPIELLFIIFSVTIGTTLYKYLYEEKGKRLLKNTLSQYLAEDLVLNVLDNYEEVKLGGTRKTITSFFSDIAGFTSISENMEPEELVHFLSIYLKEVSNIIMHERGFINKYEGDAVMALWGAFGAEEKQAIFACRAALEQQKKIQELNSEFKKTHGFEIGVRMGINKGVAVVGNIGSEGKKIEYTAIGDSVNTASRFEGINKIYGTNIIVGESVMMEAKEEFIFRKLDNIQVKGKEKPVLIYELMGPRDTISGEKIAMITRFEEGLELYFSGKFEEAYTVFSILWGTLLDEPSHTFMDRCKALKGEQDDGNWTGTFRALEK